MITPSFSEIKKLSSEFNVIPVFESILGDVETPVSVWLKLFKNSHYSFLLESVSGIDTVARYSFLGGDPFMIFRSNGRYWQINGQIQEKDSGEPLQRLRCLVKAFKSATLKGLPSFCGGAVGYFSYDSIRLWEKIPDKNPQEDISDEIFFAFYKNIIVFDNREHKLLIISNIILEQTSDIAGAYKDACNQIEYFKHALSLKKLSSLEPQIRQTSEPVSNFNRLEYENAVCRCKEYIGAGDIFQVVLSQRFSVGIEAEPFSIYRILRTINPSPYMYFLGCNDFFVIGASPELLVRVQDKTVETRPIAGTRRRGKDDFEDMKLAVELQNDSKEVAEHMMLVDLGRNDIGRVCEFGSVEVQALKHIEKYSHVMHMVTNIKGRLKEGKDFLDALCSCFPAGTLSGAPKIRAMEIIDELEPCRRGIYGGALGYIDFSGNFDSCIVIRTILYKNGVAYIQVGAGIVADSVPSREYMETVEKASAQFAALNNIGKQTCQSELD